MTQNIKSRNEIIAERDMAWKELRDIRAAINADLSESTLDCVQMLMAKHEKLLSECERVLPKPDDKPLYMPVYVCIIIDESDDQNIAGVLSDYGAAVNWLDADHDNRSLLFFALNKMAGEYVTNEEPAK